jgi:predicted transcriptional regulator of viral defense system
VRRKLSDVVARLAAEGLDFFTPADLAELLGIPIQRAREIAARMHKTNLARRVGRGLYALLPPTDWIDRKGYAVNWYVTAAHLMGKRPYFLAYYSAMEIHQMTQHPIRTVFIATTTQLRARKISSVKYRFVKLSERRFFGYEPHQVERALAVSVADLERTFIDCVDRFELCGGVSEVVRGYQRRQTDIDSSRLYRYLTKIGNRTLVRRVGFILEAVGFRETPLLWDLDDLARGWRSYVALDPSHQGKVVVNRRWGLHVPLEVIRSVRGPES